MKMAEDNPIWEERRKWLGLKRKLESDMEGLERQESFLMQELDSIDDQVAYYGSLTREMKKTLDPPRLSHLLRSWRKA
ncbi:MAG: hypothetical protein LN412_08125 [Candidatus Thermoplasmatota archaeon]|nr:hypothetical protein [Candidatus Thermoplasmatota archaeon]